MKRFLAILSVFIAVPILSGISIAETYTFSTDLLSPLQDNEYSEWIMRVNDPTTINFAEEYISSASLTFNGFYGYGNHLWVHLLDSTGVAGPHTYPEAGGDNNYDDWGSEYFLVDMDAYANGTPSTETYTFESDDISELTTFLQTDDKFGIGLDAECHYYNTSVEMTINTNVIPEPGTMFLLGSGLIGLAGFRRRFKKS